MLPLVPPSLAFPTPASVATISPALSSSASTICVLVVLVRELLPVVVVHLVPTVAAVVLRTLMSRRWAGRVAATPVAALTECAKEADLPSVDLCLRLRLGWQCRQMCLLATPLKRQTFLSVADMSEMSSRHVGNILLCQPIFWLPASCR